MQFNKKFQIIVMLWVVLGFFSCNTHREKYESGWMDDPKTMDITLQSEGEKYTLTERLPTPSVGDKNTPVILSIHGYSASTFEWKEFYDYADNNNKKKGVYVTLVLLGGHGLSYDEFKKSSWKEWGAPIIEKYNQLVDQGYTNLNIVASSTGGTLVLDHLANNSFKKPPNTIVFIDTLVVPKDKNLYLVPYFKPILGDIRNVKETEEYSQYWYVIQPKEAIVELSNLTNHIKSRLERGIQLPKETTGILYQSKGDPVVDPVSAYLIYKGLKSTQDKAITVKIVESNLHVFTQLLARPTKEKNNDANINNQKHIFDEVINLVKLNRK